MHWFFKRLTYDMKSLAMLALVLAATFAVALGGVVEVSPKRQSSATLFLNNPYDGGDWGAIAMCPEGSFSHAFEVLFYEPGALDETAVNGIKLYCRSEDGTDVSYISSSSGPDGRWFGMKVCPSGFITGFRAKVLEYQGVFSDDVGVEDMEVECQFGTNILGGIYDTKNQNNKFADGTWSVWSQCPPYTAVCGIQTRVEAPQLADDDTAVTDITLLCCDRTPA